MPGPFPLGNDTLMITNRAPILDSNGQPVTDSYNRTITAEQAITVEGCSFELLSGDETNSNVSPNTLIARAFLPYGTPVTVTSKITWQPPPATPGDPPAAALEFEVFGPPRPELDNDGQGDHIELDCHREKG